MNRMPPLGRFKGGIGGGRGEGIQERDHYGRVETPLRQTRKLRFLRVKVFDEASAGALETAIQTWIDLPASSEFDFVEIQPMGEHSCIVLYME